MGKIFLIILQVHPEAYSAAEKLLKLLGYKLEDVQDRKLGDLPKEVEKCGQEILQPR